jgi:hypothetical protein
MSIWSATAERTSIWSQPKLQGSSATGPKNLDEFLGSLAKTESGGRYDAQGPVINSGMYAGDRAYGKYQIMGKNVPAWTKQYLGKAYSAQEFLKSPQLQESLMRARAGDLFNKYGNWQDVASVHFTGRPLAQATAAGAKDQLGTTVQNYVGSVAGPMGQSTPQALSPGALSGNQLLKGTLQGFARSTAATGGFLTGRPLTPEGPFQQAIYGTNKPITFRTEGAIPGIAPENSPQAFAIGALFSALDLTPFGGAKNAVKTLKAINDVADAAKVGRTIGVPEDMLVTFAQTVTRMTDESAIKKYLDSINETLRTTTARPKAAGDIQNAPATKNAWPTIASKPSKAGSTSTGSAPTGKEGVSAQKAGTSGPFDGVDTSWSGFKKYDYERTSLPADKIKQRETVDLQSEKFKEIKKAVSRGDRTPIIVDDTGFVLDGHHRLNAYIESGANYGEVPVLRVVGKGTGKIDGVPSSPSIPKELEPGSSKTLAAFSKSTGQKPVGVFELGSFGKKSAANKAALKDRFPEGELELTQEHIQVAYNASNDPGTYRNSNIAWVAKMPTGETRVIYTRLNANGKEEILNWHKVSDPRYVETLKTFGTPAETRTRTLSLERSGSSPLSYGGDNSISQGGTPKGDRPFEAGATTAPKSPEQARRTAEQSGQRSPQTPETPRPENQSLQVKTSSLANDAGKLATNASVNINTLRISDSGKEVVSQTVAELQPILEAKLGRRLSNQEALELADNTSKVLTRAVGREQTLDWQAAMLKTRQGMAAAAETGRIDKEFLQNLIVVKTQGTDIARKLQSLSIGAEAKEATPMQTILSAILETTDNAKEILKAAEGVDFNDFRQATTFFRKFVKPKLGEWIDLVRYNSMLSSPLTHIVNAFSNAFNSSLVAPIEKALTGGLDFMGAALTGRERRYFVGESAKYVAAYFGNLKEAASRFAGALSGRRAATNLDTHHIPVATTGVKGAIATTLSTPMRVLEAGDQFFTALTEAGELAALSHRAAKGAKVGNIQTKAAEKAAYRLFRQDTFAEEQGYLLDAVDHVTNLVQMARNSKNPIVSNIAKFTAPFIRTPMNIFKQGVEYSPLGYLTLVGAANKTEQLSKAILGSAVFAGAATLLMSNRLTWAEPVNETERNAFKAAGKLPYSIKIGNTWVQYQKLAPVIAFPLSMTALIDDSIKSRKLDQSTAELILSGIAKYGDFLADQSYAKSFGDLLAAVQGGESDWARVFGNVPQQLVPFRALGGWMARLIDDVQRKPDPEGTFVEKQVQLLMMNIPGLSQKVPARTDGSGKEIEAKNNELNSFSPVRTSPEDPEGAAALETIQQIRKLEREASARNNLLKDQAEATWQDISQLPRAEMVARLKELKKANPALHDKVVSVGKAEKLDLSPAEKTLYNATTNTRAQMILDELNKTKTPEEREALIAHYREKKILTPEVAKRIRALKTE